MREAHAASPKFNAYCYARQRITAHLLWLASIPAPFP
jgi:hypothetical protein